MKLDFTDEINVHSCKQLLVSPFLKFLYLIKCLISAQPHKFVQLSVDFISITHVTQA